MTGSVCGRAFRCVVAIVILWSGLFACLPNAGHCSFNVQRDAFSISNAPGWCFAMAAFARWYYLANQDAPSLRERFDEQSQQRIARELQGFYSRNLLKIQAEYCNRDHQERAASFTRLVTGLALGEPRIVLLMNKGPKGTTLHAVLAYAWLPESSALKVYDPNYPREERFIDLNRAEYTSLDITYNAFCFPEVLHHHPGLVKKMEKLYAVCAATGGPSRSRGVVPKDQQKVDARAHENY
ncbi:MAG: hypothetical protein FJY85_08580 [Deltaproteobacteria bacterium]|nr:hypothetical protein [Deltaproteobacteria bacterium]